jgi:hypothetical protein
MSKRHGFFFKNSDLPIKQTNSCRHYYVITLIKETKRIALYYKIKFVSLSDKFISLGMQIFSEKNLLKNAVNDYLFNPKII